MTAPGGQNAPARSLLDRVGDGFLTAASSLDANIDASSLVDRLSAPDVDVPGKKVQQALVDFKDLVRRAPNAVVATQGAVSALLRILSKLAAHLGQDAELDTEEAMQDCLETLGLLLEVKKESTSSGDRGRRKAKDDFSHQRSAEVAEITIRHTEKGKDLLKLLSARSVSTRFDVMVVLQWVYQQRPADINGALLADPIALNRLMELLQDCQIDYVRNECLGLLLLLTTGSAEIRQIVTMQGLADTLFALLAEEDLTAGGKVARDLLQCLKNVALDTVCQRCIRETGGLSALVAAMDLALSGKKARGDEDEDATEDDDDEFSAIQRIQLEVSPEARWACFLLLAQVALAFLSPAAVQGSQELGGTSDTEIPPNRDVLLRNNILTLLYRLKDPRVGVEAKMHLILMFEALLPSPLVAKKLEEESADSADFGCLLSTLMGVLLGPGPPLEVQSALGRVLCRGIILHKSLQHAMLADLSPQLDLGEGGPTSSMRTIVSTLERAAVGIVEASSLWFSFQLLIAMTFGNASVQAALATMRIAFPEGDGPAEFCLDLCLAAFSGCARRCLHGSGGGQDNDGDPDTGQAGDELLGSAAPDNPSYAAAGLLASLKFLVHWLSSCKPAVHALVQSPVLLPLLVDLLGLGDSQGHFFRIQVEGLAAMLMGVCIQATQKDSQAPNLMALVAKKVGIEAYQHKLETLLRADVLQKRIKSISAFRWYSGRDRKVFKELQQGILRTMVEIYVAESLMTDSNSLADDVADQYKQLIRVQDEKFREVQRENEQLRNEVESFMSRSLKASSVVAADKMEALKEENAALHDEVQHLEKEAATKVLRYERELKRSRQKVAELEGQRQSMLVSYDQLERTVDALRKEAQELRSVQAAGDRAKSAGSELVLALAAEDAERQAEEYRKDRADLLELLNTIVQAVPQARAFVEGLDRHSSAEAAPGIAED